MVKNLSDEEKKARKDREKNYRKQNKDKIKARDKKYQAENREKINAMYRENRKKPQVKLRNALGGRVRNALKCQGVKKNKGTMDLIGCSPSFLRKYLEAQFEEGMTWKNYGNDPEKSWHMDHIRPRASFDLTDEDQQRECFHYSNIQPLWARENMIKNDTWIPEDQLFHEEVVICRGTDDISISWQSGCVC